MATFQTIYGQIFNQFDSQSLTNAKLWANQGAHEFYDVRKFAWRETRNTFATVSGQQDYVLAGATPIVPDFDGLISVRHNTANASTFKPKMKEMFQDDFDDWFGICGATPGVPAVVTLRGATGATTSGGVHSNGEQVLSFFPVMNYIGSCDLAFYRAAGSIEMTADGDVPLAPVQYHRAIIALGIAIGLRAEDQMIQASTFQQEADEIIARAVAADVALRAAEDSKMRQGVPPPTNPQQGPPYGYERSR